MKLLNDKADFVATLTYRTSDQGGRTTPVFKTGYRPQVKFAFSDMQTSGQQTFIDKGRGISWRIRDSRDRNLSG
jgi:hypothetical protein